jgi:AcrR family transcriptional regulator
MPIEAEVIQLTLGSACEFRREIMQPADFFRNIPIRADGIRSADDILDATALLLRDESAEDLSTQKIADRSGYSIGAIYRRFVSKEAIVGALIARSFEHKFQAVEHAFIEHYASTVADHVGIVVDSYAHTLNGNGRFLINLLQAALSDRTLPKKTVSLQFVLCRGLIETIQKRSSDAAEIDQDVILPVFNGILFGSFRSANLIMPSGLSAPQVNIVKQSLTALLRKS